MQKKGVRTTILLIFSMLVFCSFSFPVYASPDDNYGYNDSYIHRNATQDSNLIFIPPPPTSSYQNYLVAYSPSEEMYYMYVSNSYVTWFDIWAGNNIVNGNSWELYSSKITSNDWELIAQTGDSDFARLPADRIFFDSTIKVEGHYGGQVMFNQNTTYKFYWNLIRIFRLILDKSLDICDYIMQHTFIRYCMLVYLAGEVLIFALVLIRRIGDMRSEAY